MKEATPGGWNWLSCPVAKPGVRTLTDDDGVTVIQPADGPPGTLNETSAAIWKMCDGLTSVQAMAGLLGWRHGIPAHELEPAVLQAVVDLYELGLLRKPVAHTDLLRLKFAPGKGVGMGFFAAFHYIWVMLGRIDERWARQVIFLDDHGTDLWPDLFETGFDSTQLPRGRVFEARLGDMKRYSEAPDDMYRTDGEPGVRIHTLLAAHQGRSASRFPTGRHFQRSFSDRRARKSMYRTVSRVIRPVPDILSACAEYLDAEQAGRFTVGVHLRSAWFIGVDLQSDRYIREWVVPAVENALAARGRPRGRVFIATDVAEYVDLCRDHFGERMAVRDIPRVAHAGEDWHRLEATRLELSRNVLIDALLLARCDVVIGNPSNVLAAVLVFNPFSDLKIFDFALERSEQQAIFPRPDPPRAPT